MGEIIWAGHLALILAAVILGGTIGALAMIGWRTLRYGRRAR